MAEINSSPLEREPSQHNPERYVLGYYCQAMLEAYTVQGGVLDVLAKTCDVSTSWLCQPPVKVSVEDYLNVIAKARQITQDTNFGLHIGQHMHIATFDVLGQALLKAETLGQALEQVLELENTVHTLGHSQVFQESGCIRVVWQCYYQLHPLAREVVESVITGMIQFAQRLAGRPIPVMAATFIHDAPEPEAKREYRRLCRSRCDFNQPYNSILVADDVLAWPVQFQAQRSQGFLRSEDNTLAVNNSVAPFTHQLSQYLEGALAKGYPPLEETAGHFHLTARTLQRRLHNEKTNYQKLMSEVRYRLAEDYLSYSNMTLLDISQMLGFKEQSSFNHFFLKQAGVTPLAFRKAIDRK